MGIDLAAASAFLAGHGRVLDRRRAALQAGDAGAATAVLDAVDAYRNPDGGYGWGIEPDLRAPESQPAGALHALEAVADAGVASPSTGALLDWLARVSLPGGGLPFALPVGDPAGCSPFWVRADPLEPSLQITAAVLAQAHRAARHDASIRTHPWTTTATRFCLDRLEGLGAAPPAYVLLFALRLLDELAPGDARARAVLAQVVAHVPDDGAVPVEGGAEGESLHLLDVSPRPGTAVRAHLDPAAVHRDLDRLEAGQREDGGWAVDFATSSPSAALEWRGHATVAALGALRAHGR